MDRDRHVAVWLRMLAIKEVRLARQSYKLFKSLARKASNAYVDMGEGEALGIVNDARTDWYKLLSAHYATATQDFIAYTFSQLGGYKRTFQEIVQGFIATNALEKSRYITGTTQELMKAAILKGQRLGWGEAQIAQAVSDSIGGDLGQSRSRMIARTEIHNAASYGMQAAAEETEQNLVREWVAVHDERTRESHADADGQQRGMDEPFEVDGELIDYPGDGSAANAINCRCTLIYTPVSIETVGSTGEFLDGD